MFIHVLKYHHLHLFCFLLQTSSSLLCIWYPYSMHGLMVLIPKQWEKRRVPWREQKTALRVNHTRAIQNGSVNKQIEIMWICRMTYECTWDWVEKKEGSSIMLAKCIFQCLVDSGSNKEQMCRGIHDNSAWTEHSSKIAHSLCTWQWLAKSRNSTKFHAER